MKIARLHTPLTGQARDRAALLERVGAGVAEGAAVEEEAVASPQQQQAAATTVVMFGDHTVVAALPTRHRLYGCVAI